jgi:hypothetical protein
VDVERFRAEAAAVLDSLGDRLPPDDQDSLRTYLWAGEWALLADELAAALVEDAIPIAVAERDRVRDLLFAFAPEGAERHPSIRDRERVLAALHVVSDPPAPSPSPRPRSPDR